MFSRDKLYTEFEALGYLQYILSSVSADDSGLYLYLRYLITNVDYESIRQNVNSNN